MYRCGIVCGIRRTCTPVVSWQPLLETINSHRHTCAGIQTWNKLQARFAWMMIMIVFKRLQMGIQSTFGKKLNGQFHMERIKWRCSALEWENSAQCPINLDGPIELCMSGLVMASTIFRSSFASLMGPWGPINSRRPCVQDTKATRAYPDFARKSHFTKISR